MTVDEMIEVLQEQNKGKEVQRMESGKWVKYNKYLFNFERYIFRVKPKPIEIYINVYKSSGKIQYGSTYASKEIAEEALCGTAETVKFIEVIE